MTAIIRLETSQTFQKAFQDLPKTVQVKAQRQLQLLYQDDHHPRLRIRKMTDMGGIWEGRIDYSTRFTFERRGAVIYLRKIGSHSIYLDP